MIVRECGIDVQTQKMHVITLLNGIMRPLFAGFDFRLHGHGLIRGQTDGVNLVFVNPSRLILFLFSYFYFAAYLSVYHGVIQQSDLFVFLFLVEKFGLHHIGMQSMNFYFPFKNIGVFFFVLLRHIGGIVDNSKVSLIVELSIVRQIVMQLHYAELRQMLSRLCLFEAHFMQIFMLALPSLYLDHGFIVSRIGLSCRLIATSDYFIEALSLRKHA